MPEIKWIKITTNMFEDEKIDFIESLPESDAILVVWIKLLTLAGKCNMNGHIFLTESIPYTDEMLAHKFRRPLNVVRAALQTFLNLGMIEHDGSFSIANWDKHQNIDGMERIREQNRLRKQKQRENERLLDECHVTGHGTSHSSHAIEEEVDIDLERETTTTSGQLPIDASKQEREVLQVLSNIKGYKFDFAKDLAHIRDLAIDFPSVDMYSETKKWASYKLDNPLSKNSNARLQLRKWFENSVSYAKKKPQSAPNKSKGMSLADLQRLGEQLNDEERSSGFAHQD